MSFQNLSEHRWINGFNLVVARQFYRDFKHNSLSPELKVRKIYSQPRTHHLFGLVSIQKVSKEKKFTKQYFLCSKFGPYPSSAKRIFFCAKHILRFYYEVRRAGINDGNLCTHLSPIFRVPQPWMAGFVLHIFNIQCFWDSLPSCAFVRSKFRFPVGWGQKQFAPGWGISHFI